MTVISNVGISDERLVKFLLSNKMDSNRNEIMTITRDGIKWVWPLVKGYDEDDVPMQTKSRK